MATGKRLHEVWEALQNDGMKIPYEQFRVYVSRLRKRELRKTPVPSFSVPPDEPGHVDVYPVRIPSPVSVPADVPDKSSPPDDPLRNIREQRAKKRPGFEYDPFSANKKLV